MNTVRQVQKSFVRSARMLGTALLAASLLLGLIPISFVANAIIDSVPAPLGSVAKDVAELLPQPATVFAQDGDGEAEVGEIGVTTIGFGEQGFQLPVTITIDGEDIEKSFCAQFDLDAPSSGDGYIVVSEASLTDADFPSSTSVADIIANVSAAFDALDDPTVNLDDPAHPAGNARNFRWAIWFFTDGVPLSGEPEAQTVVDRVLNGTYQPQPVIWMRPTTDNSLQIMVGPDPSPQSATDGTITIVKNTVSGNDTFEFTSTDADLEAVSLTTAGNTATSSAIGKVAGTYTITEDTLAGWNLTNIAISGTDGATASTIDLANRQATINIDVGDAVVVTFTNEELLDYGDAPDTSSGTATGEYQTTAGDGGPSHQLGSGILLGTTVDGETGTLQNTTADADDNDQVPDDEEGVTFSGPLTIGTTSYSVDVTVVNPSQATTITASDTFETNDFTGGSGWLAGWIEDDTTNDIDLQTDQSDISLHIQDNTGNICRQIVLSAATSDATLAFSYRQNGVETNKSLIVEVGDSVANANTQVATIPGTGSNEAAYTAVSYTIPQAQLSATTTICFRQNTGNNSDDWYIDELSVSAPAPATTPSVNLVGWIDFDRDGTFDSDEAATASGALTGTQTLTWNNIGTTGPDVTAGTTYARFRISTDAIDGTTPTGVASDGEVEDYLFEIEPGAEGTITIVKQTDGNNATFDFSSTDADLNAVSITTVGTTGSSGAITKTVGTYVISEDTLAGWGVTSITFSGDTDGGSTSTGSAATIDLDEGENIVVTFNNREIIACGTNAGDLGGNIWRDFDSDGVLDASESGFSSVTVTAYDNNGLVTSAPVNSDGTYNFVDIFDGRTGDDAHIRLEFSGLPSWAASGVNGTNSGTTVQRHSAPTCAADLAVQNPAEYCEDNPTAATSCFVNGDPESAATPADVLVSWPFDRDGVDPNAGGYVAPAHLAAKDEIGSVWGLAYANETETLYTATFMRRHVGLKETDPVSGAALNNPLGAIYATDVNNATNTLFIDLSTAGVDVGTISSNAARGVNVNPDEPSTDAEAFTKVGTVGLGDLEISADGNTLYTVNLNNKEIVSIAINSDGSAGAVSTQAIPDPGCTNGEHRPFALKYYQGNLYVGLVCDASDTLAAGDVSSASGTTPPNDLTATVYRWDGGASFTSLITLPLTYPKGEVSTRGTCENYKDWAAWIDFNEVSSTCFSFRGIQYKQWPQPILSDIEFDVDGSMMLGFMDRFGHQWGYENGDLVDPAEGGHRVFATSGDLLRVHNNSGTYVLESNGSAGGVTTIGANNGQGPDGGEYYWADDSFTPANDPAHQENVLGGLAFLAREQTIILSSIRPGRNNVPDTAGASRYDSITGNPLGGYTLYQGANDPNDTGFFGKANGLGDLELLCAAAPLEIGNYVWLDEDGDGIQDPCEEPIPGVTVELLDAGGTPLATAVTDAAGEYYFVDATDPRLAAGGVYETVPISVGVATSLVASTTYQIRIDTTQAAVSAYDLTVTDANSGSTLPDGVDSDATQSGDYAIIDIVTPEAGHNDHTFDFGFKPSSVRIGNRVWYDANDNGVIDGFESSYGIDGVTVELLDSTGTITATTTTTNGGFYLFTTNLSGDLLQDGDYQVRIPATNNMGAAGSALPLDDWRSSTDTADAGDPNTDVDSDDNGPGVTSGADLTSGTVSVAVGTEPDTNVDSDDTNGNLTVDFGFYDVCDTGAGDLGGNVFRDFNSDGVNDISEPGWLSGVTVTAYDNDGNAVTTTINPDGSYDFDGIFPNPVTDADHIRLEFSGLPDWAQSGVAGSNSGTTVQHHKAASCAADLAVQNPADYCQANPDVAFNCYVAGDPVTTDTGTANLSADFDTIVGFSYDNSGSPDNNTGGYTAPTHYAVNRDTGTTWGMAYHKGEQKLLAAAFIKRHSGLGSGGIDAIYLVDPFAGTTNGAVLTNVGTAATGTISDNPTRGLDLLANQRSHDVEAYDKVGTHGLGDIDISVDGNTLYAVGLFDKSLNTIALNADNDPNTPLTVGTITSVTIPDPGCTNGEWRPFALKVHQGNVYVGGVCDASAVDIPGVTSAGTFDPTFSTTDLTATVYEYNGSTFTPVTGLDQFSLVYPKGWAATGGSCRDYRGWYPWAAAANDIVPSCAPGTRPSLVYPSPILSDIEFDDDGSMILGFVDRIGHQYGTRNYGLDNTDTTQYTIITGGEVLRASPDGNGFALENNGIAGGRIGEQDSGNGVGGGEFYWGERYDTNASAGTNSGSDAIHAEASHGGLALLPGSGEVIVTGMDPVDRPTSTDTQETNSGGVIYLSNTDGSKTDAVRLYRGDVRDGFFAKAAGIGDAELMCDLAPLEIGNYVWLDEDGDGIQDPCEEPIPGVTVELLDAGGTSLATAVTDASGEYYFVDTTDPRLQAGGVYETVPISVGVATSLTPSTTYQLRIDTTQAAVSALDLTVTDANSGSTLPDGVDSDATQSGDYAIIDIVTPEAGHNDHTFDFGFKHIESLALEKTLVSPASGVAMVGDTLTFQLQITNTGSVAVTELNLVDRYDPAILQYITASVTPDSQTAGTITWTGNFGVGTGSFLPNLPLAPGASFTVTVDMESIAPTRD